MGLPTTAVTVPDGGTPPARRKVGAIVVPARPSRALGGRRPLAVGVRLLADIGTQTDKVAPVVENIPCPRPLDVGVRLGLVAACDVVCPRVPRPFILGPTSARRLARPCGRQVTRRPFVTTGRAGVGRMPVAASSRPARPARPSPPSSFVDDGGATPTLAGRLVAPPGGGTPPRLRVPVRQAWVAMVGLDAASSDGVVVAGIVPPV